MPDHTALVTLRADRPGGVPMVLDWTAHYLRGWGHQATMVYLHDHEDTSLSRAARLRYTLTHWRLHDRPEHPLPAKANAPLPLPLWGMYLAPQWLLGRALQGYDQHFYIGGPCLAALPLALRGTRFLIWFSTVYEDEIEGKALSGDLWAAATLYSPAWKIVRAQERFILRRAARIITHSPYTRDRVLEIQPGLADRVDVALVPQDPARFSPGESAARARFGAYVLAVGRMNDPRKNFPLLAKAFRTVRETIPDLSLVVVGEPPGPAILDLIADLGLGDAVHFLGQTDEETLIDTYRGATCFALSSTQEGLGIVALEAMACGVPVVATDCGGPRGIVINGETGRLVPNRDEAAFAAALRDLLTQPDLREKLIAGALAYIETHARPEAVERVLWRNFTAVFPDSMAARRS